ncbi:MAG: SIS domain-containing protein [Deltaproteobacteria bacterium]|nr:SIS domain-containing protein [Deltaproteobacteria bacterium]
MSGAKRLDLAGTGSMVVDRICATPRAIGPDEKILLQPDAQGRVVRQLVGGVTLNHLGWARLFGLRVGIFGKQAADADGRFLRAGMASVGIETALDLSGGASSFAQVYVDPQGGRAIYMARGATGELSASDVDERHRAVIESARTVTTEISQVPLEAVVRVLETARECGALGVVDVDVPLRDAVPGLGSEAELHAALESAAVIKASLSSLEGLVEGSDPEAIAKQIARRYSPEAVVLTLGADGAAVFVDGRFSRVAAASADVTDTTGAGDAFLGGLLAGRHLGLDWEASALLGNACGAACCERYGGFPDAPAVCLERALAYWTALGGAALSLGDDGPAASSADAAVGSFLDAAGREIERATAELDRPALTAAASLIRESERDGGRVHVTGVGKPEHLAHYAASLLSSTGTPAVFLHGTEATHGSVGQLRPGDVVIAISNSGATPELLATADAVLSRGARLVAVTGSADSPLGRAAEVVLEAAVSSEGGPLDLAPRASILVEALVLQALSVELQAGSDFGRREYHERHPAGALGARSAGGDDGEDG